MRFATFGRGVWDCITGSTVGIPTAQVPSVLTLGVHLDPVSGGGVIGFALPRGGGVRIELLDVAGRRVRGVLDADRPAGPGEVAIDSRDDGGRDLKNGLYLVRLATPTGVRITRFMLLH
jgi:hypothetical protein